MQPKSNPNPAPTLIPVEPVPCASYERVSTTIQALQGYSLQTQRLTADQFVELRPGWYLADNLRFRDGEEEDASGADSDLPDLLRCLAAAKAGAFKVLLVPVHDRLARNMGKAIAVEEQLEKYGVQVVYLNAPDDGSPEGKLLRHNLHAFAEYDREKRKILTSLNRMHKARLGRWVGNGATPYGYRPIKGGPRQRTFGLEPDPDEAAIIVSIFERAVTDSQSRILRWLDESGTPWPGQARGLKGAADGWGSSTLHSILTNRLYLGEGHHADITIPVPRIISDELWARVEEGRARRRNRPGGKHTNPPEDDPYLLRGRLLCGHCSKPGRDWYLRTEAMPRGARRYYTCANRYESRTDRIRVLPSRCSLPSLRADLIEDLAWRTLCEALSNPDLLDEKLRAAEARNAAERSKHGDRLDAIDRAYQRAMRTLERTTRRLNELDDDDIEAPALARQRTETRKQLDSLKAERLRVQSTIEPIGLSTEQVALFKAELELLGPALADADRADRQRIIRLLDLRAYVYAIDDETDEAMRDAVQIQVKPKRYVRLEWLDVTVGLGNGRRLFKLRLLPNPWHFEALTIIEPQGYGSAAAD